MGRVNDGCKKRCRKPASETKYQSGSYDRYVVDPLIYLVPNDLISRRKKVKDGNEDDHHGNDDPYIQAVSRGDDIEGLRIHLVVRNAGTRLV